MQACRRPELNTTTKTKFIFLRRLNRVFDDGKKKKLENKLIELNATREMNTTSSGVGRMCRYR